MKKIKTEIIINKDVSTVWKVLTDFENYPNWDPFVRSIQGRKSVGEKLKVACKQPNGKMIKFKPTVFRINQFTSSKIKRKFKLKLIA